MTGNHMHYLSNITRRMLNLEEVGVQRRGHLFLKPASAWMSGGACVLALMWGVNVAVIVGGTLLIDLGVDVGMAVEGITAVWVGAG